MKLQRDGSGKTLLQRVSCILFYSVQKTRVVHEQDLPLALASQRDRQGDVPCAVLVLLALLAFDKDVVRQLVVETLEQGGASRLAGNKGGRARVALVLVEKRRFRQSKQQRLARLVDAVAAGGREHKHIAEQIAGAQPVRQGQQQTFVLDEIHLVERDEKVRRGGGRAFLFSCLRGFLLAHALEQRFDGFLAARRIDDPKGEIGTTRRRERLLLAPRADLVVRLRVETRRIFQHELARVCRDDRTHDLARQVALAMHLRKGCPRKGVQQRRLAGVARADQGRDAAVLFHGSLLRMRTKSFDAACCIASFLLEATASAR